MGARTRRSCMKQTRRFRPARSPHLSWPVPTLPVSSIPPPWLYDRANPTRRGGFFRFYAALPRVRSSAASAFLRSRRLPERPRMDIWEITVFTIATAALATLLMLPPGLFLAWLLARGRFHGSLLVDTAVSLPLVMPPVATGLVLLALVAPRGPLGRLLAGAGVDIVFTWKAVVLAMAVMGLPLFVRTVRAGLEQVDRRYEAAASTL